MLIYFMCVSIESNKYGRLDLLSCKGMKGGGKKRTEPIEWGSDVLFFLVFVFDFFLWRGDWEGKEEDPGK